MCMWSLCAWECAKPGSVRITVGKGADNGVVPTVRTEALSPPFFEKSQTLASIHPRGMMRRRHHLLASTSHLGHSVILRSFIRMTPTHGSGLSAAWESETVHEG